MLPRHRVPLFRAALASALIGHWVANAIADPAEYAAVGLRYEGQALRPILVQSVLVALFLVVCTVTPRPPWWRSSRLDISCGRSRWTLTLILSAIQLATFSAMELTERLALGESYAAAFRSGVIDRAFALELVVATASALLLVGIAILLSRAVRALLTASPRPPTARNEPRRRHEAPFARRVLLLAGSGGLRSPPFRDPQPVA